MTDDVSPPPRHRKKIWIRVVLFLVVLAALGGTGFTLAMKIKFADFQPPMAPANVIVTKAEFHSFEDRIEAIGTAKANESTDLTSTVAETVKAIKVGEGEFVPAGSVLVELKDDEEMANLNEATRSYMRYNRLAAGNLSSVAERDAAKAKMEVAQAQLNERRIVAPFDGVTGIRHVSVGDLVSPGTLVTTIDDIDLIKADFSVPEIYLSSLKNGLKLKAFTEAYPDQEFEGTIYTVDSRVNPVTRSIMVRAVIENANHLLRPGLLLNIVMIKSSQRSIAIPEEALMSSGENLSVYVVTSDHKIESCPVKAGLREPGYVQILSGLNEGDRVVIEGQMKTGPGATVNIAEEKSLAASQESALDYAVPRKQNVIEPLDQSSQEQKAR